MEKATALRISAKDNVATTLKEVAPGEVVGYLDGESMLTVTAREAVPIYHKIALENIAKDELIYKYGEIIGGAMVDIPEGSWVSHYNIMSLPRNYEDELNW